MRTCAALLFGIALLLTPAFVQPSAAQVLGSCGAANQNQPAPADLSLEVRPMPLPGDRAVNFELMAIVDQDLKTIKLSDYNGEWRVVFFYPADFSTVWPTELAAVAENAQILKKIGVTFIAISKDTHLSHKAWKDASPRLKKIKYPMASDPTGDVTRAYGVYNPKTGFAHRAYFIVDREGFIQSVQVVSGSLGRSVREMIRQLHALQALEESPGEMAPEGWNPGDALMSPGK